MAKQQVALKIKANANNQASASFRTGEKQERLYYLDWLRVLAVLVVFFCPYGMALRCSLFLEDRE